MDFAEVLTIDPKNYLAYAQRSRLREEWGDGYAALADRQKAGNYYPDEDRDKNLVCTPSKVSPGALLCNEKQSPK